MNKRDTSKSELVDSVFYVLQKLLRRAAHTCDGAVCAAAVRQVSTRKQYTTHGTRLPHRGACYAKCVRSAPLGTPRTASRRRSSGSRRRAVACLLLAGDTTFEDQHIKVIFMDEVFL